MPKPPTNANNPTQTNNSASAIEVSCPGCSAKVTWSSAFPLRPFCSERCKNNDFIDWANEQHRISGSSEFDDVLSETLQQAQTHQLH